MRRSTLAGHLRPRRIGWLVAIVAISAATLVACGGHAAGAAGVGSRSAVTRAAVPASVPAGDWLRFDYDARRSGVGPLSTGITAQDVRSLSPRVVSIPGVADS